MQALCNIYGRRADSPFREYDERGKVLNGCIDGFHTDALKGIIGESTRWHFRPEAKMLRRSAEQARKAR